MRWPWAKKPDIRKLCRPIERHLGVSIVDAQSVAHEIRPIQRVNVQRATDGWVAAAGADAVAFGFSTTGYFSDDGLTRYLVTDELIQAPVERTQLESGLGEVLDCVTRGMYLFRRGGAPVVVAFRPPRFTHDSPILEVIGPTREAARGALTALLADADRLNVYKGRTISLESSSGGWPQGFGIRFHELRETAREDIVLPDELIRVVERNVLGMLKHGETLRAAGRSLRHGLLFHGAPGTGKTMMIRYLASACRDHTVILVAGAEPGVMRESCQIAKMLAPSIVVLEDVDLIAPDREAGGSTPVLHHLMNEMDGLGPRAEVIFMLTTNRPDVLEPALAARPGRVDQAVEFPLPDDECRRRLFAVYGRGLDLAALDLPRWIDQTSGVSPAFIEELLRKAALMAAERGAEAQPLTLTDNDVQAALRELVFFGGELTQRLLGYRTPRLGYITTKQG